MSTIRHLARASCLGLLAAAWAPAALATNPTLGSCDGNDAPGVYASIGCDTSICSLSNPAGAIWILTCDALSSCDDHVDEWSVYNYDGSEQKIVAFGTCFDSGGDSDFCCELNDPSDLVTKVELKGTDDDATPDDGADKLSFYWDEAPIAKLENHKPSGALKGVIYARSGNDHLHGSYSSETDYTEFLFGNGDIDYTYGYGGVDYLYAGGGDDPESDGGPQADRIWLEAGNDTVSHGGEGIDCVVDKDDECPLSSEDDQTIYLGGGDDYGWVARDGAGTCAGAGDFHVYGEDGYDVCGDADWGGSFFTCEDETSATEWGDLSEFCAKVLP